MQRIQSTLTTPSRWLRFHVPQGPFSKVSETARRASSYLPTGAEIGKRSQEFSKSPPIQALLYLTGRNDLEKQITMDIGKHRARLEDLKASRQQLASHNSTSEQTINFWISEIQDLQLSCQKFPPTSLEFVKLLVGLENRMLRLARNKEQLENDKRIIEKADKIIKSSEISLVQMEGLKQSMPLVKKCVQVFLAAITVYIGALVLLIQQTGESSRQLDNARKEGSS